MTTDMPPGTQKEAPSAMETATMINPPLDPATTRQRRATTHQPPFYATLRWVDDRQVPVVVDRRTDRAELRCETMAEAGALAAHLNHHV